ncbi:gamma-glutamylcyclotransferase family protein [Mesorhizobium sp. AA22]|uniref:gamma-glutamylcyclotransferase family protein n=1 Tax=Mesorhizobium sp. AA22 TaxID=1854057 RepID=UPI0007ECBE06|nr:gamma-glutamylcyclotransferase family protein [Mesorhizobium sp. AA22]QIA23269.1 gamma-glutamylcyclotransferase [Mesorhizobium sp. AA22]
MAQNVFVFGTLKKGFPLHQQGLASATMLGPYRTQARFPLLIAGPRFAPMMFNEPGIGFHVVGELYIVEERAMENLDCIESIGKPENLRVSIDVKPIEGGRALSALACMKTWDLAEPVHSGYLDVYDDRRFILPAKTKGYCDKTGRREQASLAYVSQVGTLSSSLRSIDR